MSVLKICAECGRLFKPTCMINILCSDECRVRRQRESIRDYYKRHPEKYAKWGRDNIEKVRQFYIDNPASIYMPERQKLVDKHRFGSPCGRKPIGVRQVIAVHNTLFHIRSDKMIEMEKIDMDTLKGVPSEQKDAIIKALFDALKAKKEAKTAQEAKPAERKMSKKGEIFLKFSKMRDREFISFEELVKEMKMNPMTVWNAVYNLMTAGYVSMTMTKLSPMSSDWLDKRIYFGYKE